MRKNIIVALKGFGMGAANVVPGVSGGTIALLTGIYQQIVDAISAFTDKKTWKALLSGQFKEFWNLINGTFLVFLGTGVVASIFSLAYLMTWALDCYPILTWAFFFGLILASVFFMLKDVKGWGWKDTLFMVCGIGLGVVVCTLTPTTTPSSLPFIFIYGAIAICTMILPGVSGSFILVILDKYDYIMTAISELDIPVLLTFAAGCAAGLLAFARLLRWLLARAERQTMLVLIGFVTGSLIRVWPWADRDRILEAQSLRGGDIIAGIDLQIPGALVCCLAGIALVVVLCIIGEKKNK